MKKFTWLCVIVCLLALLAVGCASESGEEQTTTTTQATTEEVIEGLEDSIFDDPTVNVDPTGNTTIPQETTTEPNTQEQTTTQEATAPSVAEGETLSYEAWLKLTPAEQRRYQESFSDIEAFYVWYDAAKKAYEEANPPIEIEGGTVDLSTLPT